MTKWKVEYLEGVLAGIVKEGCSSPFVTMHYSDAEAVVQEHNNEINTPETMILYKKESSNGL